MAKATKNTKNVKRHLTELTKKTKGASSTVHELPADVHAIIAQAVSGWVDEAMWYEQVATCQAILLNENAETQKSLEAQVLKLKKQVEKLRKTRRA